MNPVINIEIRDFNTKQLALRYLSKLKPRHYQLSKFAGTWVLMMTDSVDGKDDYPLALAAANYFQHANKGGVFYWIGHIGKKVSILAFRDGIPYASEALGGADGVNTEDLGRQILQLNNRLQIERAEVIGDAEILEKFGDSFNFSQDVVGFSMFIPFAISDMVFTPYQSKSRVIALSIVMVLVVSGVLYDKYGQTFFKKPALKIEAPIVHRDYAKEYQNAIESLLVDAGTPSSSFQSALDTYLKSAEIGRDGWVVDQILCTTAHCVEYFINKNGSQNGLFNLNDKANFPEQEKAESTSPFVVVRERLMQSELPKFAEFSRNFVTSIQQIQVTSKVQLRIDSAAVIGASKDLPINQVPADKHIKRGQFFLTGPLGALGLVTERLPKNTGIDTFKVSGIQGSDVRFEITGAYYVK